MPRRALFLTGTAAIALLLGAQSSSTQGQQTAPPASADTPVFRSSVDASHVDVTVLDRNDRPVSDLNVSDFQLIAGGQPKEIITFARVVAPATTVSRPFGAIE